MPSLSATACGRGAAVAGEHDDFDAVGVQQLNRFRRARFDRIGHAQESGGLAIDGDEHRRLAFAAQRFGASRAIPVGNSIFNSSNSLALPNATSWPSIRTDYAFAGDRSEFFDLGQIEICLFAWQRRRWRRPTDVRCDCSSAAAKRRS